jgi:hypothetical protein
MITPKIPVNRISGLVLAYLMIASFCLISRPVYAEDRPASEYLKLSSQTSPPEVHPKWVKMFVSNTNPARRIEATLHVNVEHYAPPHDRKLDVEEKVVHIPAGGIVQYAEYSLPEHFESGGIRLEGVKIIRVVFE